MKVLHLTTSETARFYRTQLESLRAHGVTCTSLAVPGNQYDDQANSGSRSPLAYLRFYPRVLRESLRDYDLVHANYGLTGPIALGQVRLPVVLSLFGSDLMGKYGWLSRGSARLSDAVIVMSRGMAGQLDTDAHVIPHGVDFDRFEPTDRERACRSVGWDPDVANVLFPYPPTRTVKDYPRAERVAAAAAERIDRPLKLQTLSGVPHEEMSDYYNAADALLLTSRREGSPNTVKEALACNLPVVATDVGDVGERLEGVEPSFVRTSDEGLVRGLVSVLERRERSNGREVIADLDLDRMAERIAAVYRSVIDEDDSGADRSRSNGGQTVNRGAGAADPTPTDGGDGR